MTDDVTAGPFHLRVDAEVRVSDPGRLASLSEAELSTALAELIRRHAWEAGLQLTDPQSVHVAVTRSE